MFVNVVKGIDTTEPPFCQPPGADRAASQP